MNTDFRDSLPGDEERQDLATPGGINYEKKLMDLLCIIHGDGGQYITEHGEDKAIQDAKEKAAALVAATAEFLDTAFSWSVILKNGR